MTFREEVTLAAATFKVEPIGALPFSLYRLFNDTGDRLRFEEAYFSRRRRLVALGLAAWNDRRAENLTALEDAIWAICDEFTWALPAHLGGRSLEPAALGEHETCLDLFACETAFALAEIRDLLGADLAPVVVSRAAAEVERRVLVPFVARSDPWDWELMRNNWCAVCGGSVGAAALYLHEDGSEREAILLRVLATLDRFIDSFTDDGASLEGLGYWTYGVGFFTAFADLLVQRTAGRIDLLASPKFRRIAAFQGAAYLNGELAVSFADGDAHERWRPGLSAYLARRFPEARVPPAPLAATLADDRCGRWALSYRDLLWAGGDRIGGAVGTDPNSPAADATKLAAASPNWFPDAQWLICPATARGAVAFAAKGGHNDEPHNHNDVGSFLLACGGDELIADLGAGEYVKDYFNESRYSIFCCSSESHSVPMVNGRPQTPGAERRAMDVSYRRVGDVSILSMDIAAAYGEAALRRLLRRFEFADSGVLTLVDEFIFDRPEVPIVERFVTRCDVVSRDSGAIIRGKTAALKVSADGARPLVREHDHREHDGRSVKVRSLDFSFTGARSDSGPGGGAVAGPEYSLIVRFEFRPHRPS